ncbi:glycine/D-amino acid oxidase-like deaminating enzyme [Sphingomonas kyeonggiensis]|uniref:tryptophan halogenase family protein n=1 Tax=Sphingomonas kyeonggiensis TaxID=1268553 RepID=UPI0027886809|nr:tryptophan halogenase family protein [Sphingomonas kyeonggiensis]MDQ0249694.1 glycine/D-amino acid oxidase-like deaminating enzyme [Sphingomonas kyeonggiensis]
MGKRRILIVGGGTAGWLTAAYLARYLDIADQAQIEISLLESPELGIIGVGEGTFPTIRSTLKFLGIDETQFIRATSATFKQGIRFNDWLHAPLPDGTRHHYLHPFEAPFYTEGTSLVPYWLLQDEAVRPPFAEAVTIQNRVAESRRAPKKQGEGEFSGPLNYAYHFDAAKLARILKERAVALGVRHLAGLLTHVALDADGAIARVETRELGALEADLYIDCSGFRAELIGKALGAPFKSVRDVLFADRALAAKIPYGDPDAPIESFTIAAAHEAGWTWDIGLEGARGIGTVYSSAHMTDDEAAQVLRTYIGHDDFSARLLPFEPGYRETQWVKNCVAVGLSGGFVEPLESTGVLLIEAAVGMIAELFPHGGPVDAPAKRFNQLIVGRYERIIDFLKLHYCLSRRDEPFWRDNADPASIPDTLQELLRQWRHRPPGRFDFLLDLESFAFFNYQYILYGMDFRTDLSGGRGDFPNVAAAEKLFARIRGFSERATEDLPTHRALIRAINA